MVSAPSVLAVSSQYFLIKAVIFFESLKASSPVSCVIDKDTVQQHVVRVNY